MRRIIELAVVDGLGKLDGTVVKLLGGHLRDVNASFLDKANTYVKTTDAAALCRHRPAGRRARLGQAAQALGQHRRGGACHPRPRGARGASTFGDSLAGRQVDRLRGRGDVQAGLRTARQHVQRPAYRDDAESRAAASAGRAG
jgi:hypothetical protein